MKKVAFHTLGCKLNYSETATLSRKIKAKGYQEVTEKEEADVIVINTCSVTENADKKCRQLVRKVKVRSPHARVVVTGCYAQLKPDEVAQISGVNAVLGSHEKFTLPDLIDQLTSLPTPQVYAVDIQQSKTFVPSHSLHDRTRAFLKVQDGCNYSCSFCTIPQARGQSRSGSISNLIEEAKKIGDDGIKEIVLTGVNIGDFGLENGRRKERLLSLIQALDRVDSVERFRISSIEPNLLSESIIEFVATSQRFMPHFHIPLQSGSNHMLKKMKRRYTRELYQERVNTIKCLMPSCCIGADVITGFPGETHEDFMETHTFLQHLPLSYLHVFTYSERANTPATTMEEQIPLTKRKERTTLLRLLGEKKKRHFYETNTGTTEHVLFEQDIQNGCIRGFTKNYIRVATPYHKTLINQLKMVSLDTVNAQGIVESRVINEINLKP